MHLHPDRLFPADPTIRAIARELYGSVAKLPIISPHGHTDPEWWATDANFGNAAELLLHPDHYVFRMLYSQGISLDALGIGNPEADPRESWRLFAERWHLFRGTPSAMWLNWVFAESFGIEVQLAAETSDQYYDQITEALATDAFKPRALFERYNIEVIATTESPLDDLRHHMAIRNSGWQGRVITAYRPDPVVDPEFEGFRENLKALSDLTGEDCFNWAGYLAAHRKRRAFFAKMGATSTDHGHPTALTSDLSPSEAEALFSRVTSSEFTAQEAELFRAQMLTEMAGMSVDDGLYSVAERSGDGITYRLIGAVQKVLVAMPQTDEVVAALSAPETHIVSFTITEKGYCRAPDGTLDLNLNEEVSIYTFLTAGFRRRKDAGLPGLTLLSCDNPAHNGVQLERLTKQYLEHNAPDLIEWFENECTCPSTMVDRIVPATTPADLDAAQAALGYRDEAHVVTEPFSQWVIENRFAGPRPRWEDHGAEIVADVAPYETAKLRMLNGAHSAIAYIGLKHGHEFVHQAIADPAIRPLIDRLMREEAAPSIAAAPGQDLNAYADALLTRFENPALNHRLAQIAMDGSQKIPQRWLETLKWNREQGRGCPAIVAGLDAWFAHIKGANGPVDDPRAAELAKIELSDDVIKNVGTIFGASEPVLKLGGCGLVRDFLGWLGALAAAMRGIVARSRRKPARNRPAGPPETKPTFPFSLYAPKSLIFPCFHGK